MSGLPPPGRWALGSEAQPRAEALVLAAQQAGRRTGWLAAEAGFLSNLTVLENLRLLYDWQRGEGDGFDAAVGRALAELGLGGPDWLLARPSQLAPAALGRARLLRLLVLRPDLVVLQPASLAEAGAVAAARLIAGLEGACLLLLAEPAPDWPAWPPAVTVDASPAAGPAEDPRP